MGEPQVAVNLNPFVTMSDDTTTSTDVLENQTDLAASDEEVAEAVDALVKSVEAEGQAHAVEPGSEPVEAVKTAPKKRAAKKATAGVPQETVDSLLETVNTLAASVSSLTGTVDSLSAKVSAPPPQTGVTVEQLLAQVEATDEDAVEPVPSDAGNPIVVAASHLASMLALFVGTGLVAAGCMRHHVAGSAIVEIVVGIALFVASSLYTERKTLGGIVGAVTFAGASLLTVLGLGFVVGGLQDFGAESKRAAALVPAGVALFSVGAILRSRIRLPREHIMWLAGAGVWVCLFLALGLGHLAGSDEPSATEPATTPAPAAEVPAADEHATTDEHATAEATTTEADAATHDAEAATASTLR